MKKSMISIAFYLASLGFSLHMAYAKAPIYHTSCKINVQDNNSVHFYASEKAIGWLQSKGYFPIIVKSLLEAKEQELILNYKHHKLKDLFGFQRNKIVITVEKNNDALLNPSTLGSGTGSQFSSKTNRLAKTAGEIARRRYHRATHQAIQQLPRCLVKKD